MSPMFMLTASDIFALSIGMLVLVYLVISTIKIMIKQARCKHDGGVNETQACDAICRKCGKNLGFIGTWRKQNGGKQ